MANIKVIQYEEAEGRLKEIYDELIERRGKLAEVHKIQSLHPESIMKHMELYMEIMFTKSPLSRAQREMIAVVVSKANNCLYCMTHHGAALNHFWKDDAKLELFKEDYTQVDLSEIDKKLCDLAWTLSKYPGVIDSNTHIESLRDSGADDTGMLDATLVIAYFNFVNRIVLGLGVALEPEQGVGYKYD